MEELSVNLSSTTEVSFDGLDIFDLDGDLIDNILDDLDNEIQTVIVSIIIHITVFDSTSRFWPRFGVIFGGNLRLWSHFASPQYDLWCPNFIHMESRHFSAECKFPFSDPATRKDSRTNSAKIALSQWDHYLAAVFILKFSLFWEFRANLMPDSKSAHSGGLEYGIRIDLTAL